MKLKRNKSLYIFIILFGLTCPTLHAALVTIDMNDETMKKLERMTHEMQELVPKFSEELKKSLPIMREEASQFVKESLPDIEKSLVRSGKDVMKAMRLILSPLKIVPLIGMGFTGSVAAIMMLRKGIEKYLDADESNRAERSKGLKLVAAGLTGIIISSMLMVKSDSIVKFFSS